MKARILATETSPGATGTQRLQMEAMPGLFLHHKSQIQLKRCFRSRSRSCRRCRSAPFSSPPPPGLRPLPPLRRQSRLAPSRTAASTSSLRSRSRSPFQPPHPQPPPLPRRWEESAARRDALADYPPPASTPRRTTPREMKDDTILDP